MYGNASQPSRVYLCGARAPIEHGDVVREQLRLARRYRNALVEQDRKRRDRAREIVGVSEPRLLELEQRIDGLTAKIDEMRDAHRAANAKRRKRQADKDAQQTIRWLRKERKELRAELRPLKRDVYRRPEVRGPLEALDAEDLVERKRLRAESGLHWGTYLTVEQGLSKMRSKGPPRFVGRHWPGKVAVQVQHGATWQELLDGHGQARIEPWGPRRPAGAPAPSPDGRRSRRPWYLLRIRVGGTPREGIFAAIPFVCHREPPPEARVKWIHVRRILRGCREEWSVQLVLAAESWDHGDTVTARGACGIDLGWRSMGSRGLRVAYLVGDDGYEEELMLPRRWVKALRHAESLQSIRDREFNAARFLLREWRSDDHPAWFLEATATLRQWRSPARLAGLVLRWRGERFDGDEDVYRALEDWRAQDRHLYDWQQAERAKVQRRRDDVYRRFAAQVRWRYEHVVIEGGDLWKQLGRKPSPESADCPRWQETRWEARASSPGRLREILESGHPNVTRAPASMTTRRCHVCGANAKEGWDARTELMYECSAGHREDQDRQAAINLLRVASGPVRASSKEAS